MSKYVKKNAYVYHKDKLEGQTVRYWAKHYNVSRQCIYLRLEKNGNPHPAEKKIKPPKVSRPRGRPRKVKPVEMFDGFTYEQLAQMYGVSTRVISNRIRWYGDNWKKSFKRRLDI